MFIVLPVVAGGESIIAREVPAARGGAHLTFLRFNKSVLPLRSLDVHLVLQGDTPRILAESRPGR